MSDQRRTINGTPRYNLTEPSNNMLQQTAGKHSISWRDRTGHAMECLTVSLFMRLVPFYTYHSKAI